MASLPGDIYTGTWTNWDRGRVLGSTITISTQQGLFLTAFLAIWITWTGAHLWGILCFWMMQHQSTPEPRDGLHHQRQALLRNSGAPGDAFWSLSKVAWAWRRRPESKAIKRSMPAIAVALLHMAAFAVAGIFSSRVTQAGAEVLVAPGTCGWLSTDVGFTYNRYAALRSTARESLTYARSCYSSGESSDDSNDDGEERDRTCRQYSRVQLGNRTIDFDAKCPFDASMCGGEPSMSLDTGYVSSSSDFGINTPNDEEMWLRKVVTWSPLNLTGHVGDPVPASDSDPNETISSYYLGDSIVDGVRYNFTFQLSNAYRPENVRQYILTPFHAYLNESDQDYFPIVQLNRTDADVTVLELNNFMNYEAPTTDALYGTDQNISSNGYYTPLNRYTALAATEQYQLCTAPEQASCTPLSGIHTQPLSTLTLTPSRTTLASHLLRIMRESTIDSTVGYLGSQSLLIPDLALTEGRLVSIAPPPYQWLLDAEHIHNISLAFAQRLAVHFVAHSSAPVIPGVQVPLGQLEPLSTDQLRLCALQKVRSYTFASFTTLGVALIFSVGGLVMLVNCCLSDVVKALRARRAGAAGSNEKSVEWIETEVLQLQRLAVEGRNVGGAWAGLRSAVPVPVDVRQVWSSSVLDGKDAVGMGAGVGGRAGEYQSVRKDEGDVGED
ncbi:hypothetical protein EJ05DRAFT_511825 [Pseudovirgaria hyperparasitica]|uniref:Uncharacterized protein n=1 Tax=Pseudovirgaria hyperparasitica TaxID=470096 RepID=A0A6A6W7M0_9PEZI|nr:uncharacterized protein EJ05DRAFT_511825 [Pseudovirgaria hyperparasitica]KAF2757081.1 hypothetical protein EJ05DRAFT_511825 [Pseudovirgaria hyperparasitica]